MLVLSCPEDTGIRLTLPTGEIVKVLLLSTHIGKQGGGPYAKIGIDAPRAVSVDRITRDGITLNKKREPNAV